MYSVRIQNGTIWNSFFDIGTLASENEYLYIESLYIDLLLEIAREIDVAFFVIAEFENYDSSPLHRNVFRQKGYALVLKG